MIARREFVRRAALVGLAAGTVRAPGAVPMEPTAAVAAATLPFPPADPNARVGGRLRVGQMVAKMNDPATFNWNEMANQARPMLEYLTMIGTDNVVRPMLADAWYPAADLKTWTLHIRPGVMWHNGEELTADHVAWNVRRWADPTLGSSNRGLSTFAALAGPASVEVLDRSTLRLHLAKPVLSVAEDCSEFCTLIMHPAYGAPLSRHPMGTGAYTLTELKVGERCVLKRVTRTTDGREFRYWGGDVYLDEIHFYNYEQESQTAALASGSVDAAYELTVEQMELARSIPGAKISTVETAQSLVLRMQVDAPPFDDIRVRRAIVMAADNAAIKAVVYPENGSVAQNFHVAPVQPEFSPLPPLVRDVAAARRLLKEAGHATGLDIVITVGNNDGPWHQSVCEALRDQLQEAGIRLAVNVVPPTKFWEVWNQVPFGATSWAHRPLATMTLAQGYRSGAAWNESHFSDPQFDAALADVESTLDLAARRAKMRKVEKLLQDAAVIVQPFWRPIFALSSAQVHGYLAHPSRQMQLNKVWLA